jgi:GH24 family phage-related lysozyme (muramidase)
MRHIVKEKWREFNTTFEGLVPFMYQDTKGLITIGMGNLIDPVSLALNLPFQWRNKPGVVHPGSPATHADIRAEWHRIKNDTTLAKKGYRACDPLCNLELNRTAIAKLIFDKLQANEIILKRVSAFSDFDTWPADAQMGLLSMAWAMGPGFADHHRWPKFRAACAAADFDDAAANCRMHSVHESRNIANKRLFENAASVIAGEADGSYVRDKLYYPMVIMAPITLTA